MVDITEFEADKNLEFVFDPALTRTPPDRVAEPRAVFLTGATGFVGAFLLAELLEQTPADVYCLVRAADVDEGRIRIQRSLATYQLWNDCFQNRICPVVGDLGLPWLGLSPEGFQTLAETVDVIHHNGALVNFVYPYGQVRAPNVLGTLEVLKLATGGRIKPVHFVSTLSVFSPAAYHGQELIDEDTLPEPGETLGLGFTQSKWMAERLVASARLRGLPVCIHRLGRIVGHSRTGACQNSDAFWKLIKACIRMGKIPRLEAWIGLVPVDYVARSIVYFSKQAALSGKTFHYVGPNAMPLTQFIQWMNAYGYWLEQVPYNQWRNNLIEVAALSPESNEASLAPLFWGTLLGARESGIQFGSQSTEAALAGTPIACPPLDDALLKTYFAYFLRTGFLDPPAL